MVAVFSYIFAAVILGVVRNSAREPANLYSRGPLCVFIFSRTEWGKKKLKFKRTFVFAVLLQSTLDISCLKIS